MKYTQMSQKNNSQLAESQQLSAPKVTHSFAPIQNQNQHALCQSYKFQHKWNSTMHDPELTTGLNNAKPNLFANDMNLDERSDSKSKIKIRMYGSKRSLCAYTAVLTGNENESKFVSENQGRTSNLLYSGTPDNPTRPASTSHDRNKKKVIGCRKKVPPSLTMIDPNTSMEINSNWRQPVKPNSPRKNNFNLKIVMKEPSKTLKKHALSKPKVIGRQIKISAIIDEVNPDFENINASKIEEKLQQQPKNQLISENGFQPHKNNNNHLDYKKEELDDLNLENVVQAQKKFLYESQPSEMKQIDHMNEQKNEIKPNQDLISSFILPECNQIKDSKIIKEVNSQASEHLIFKFQNEKPFLAYSKIPSVILTPNKKIKAHFEFIQPEKQPRATRYGHFLQQKNPARILILDKNMKAQTSFIKKDEKDMMIHADQISEQKNGIKFQIQSKFKKEQKNVLIERQGSLKKAELSSTFKKLDLSIQKKPSLILSSKKNTHAHFQFLQFNDSSANPTLEEKNVQNRQKIIVTSTKSIEAYFEYLNQSMNKSNDKEDEDEISRHIKREINFIIQSQISWHQMMLRHGNTIVQNIFSHEKVSSSNSIQFSQSNEQKTKQNDKQQNRDLKDPQNTQTVYDTTGQNEKKTLSQKNQQQSFSPQERRPQKEAQVSSDIQKNDQQELISLKQEQFTQLMKFNQKNELIQNQSNIESTLLIKEQSLKIDFQSISSQKQTKKLQQQKEEDTALKKGSQSLRSHSSLKNLKQLGINLSSQPQSKVCENIVEQSLFHSYEPQEKSLKQIEKIQKQTSPQKKNQPIADFEKKQVSLTKNDQDTKQQQFHIENQKQISIETKYHQKKIQELCPNEIDSNGVIGDSLKVLEKQGTQVFIMPIQINQIEKNDSQSHKFLSFQKSGNSQNQNQIFLKVPSQKSFIYQQNNILQVPVTALPDLQNTFQKSDSNSSSKIQEQKNMEDDNLIDPSNLHNLAKEKGSAQKCFKRTSNKKLSSVNPNNQQSVVKKVGIYRLKQNKENFNRPKQIINFKKQSEPNDNQQKNYLELEEKMAKSLQKSNGLVNRSYSPVHRNKSTSKKIKISSPYLSSAFAVLKLDGSKNENRQGQKQETLNRDSIQKRQVLNQKVINQQKNEEDNFKLKKQSLTKRKPKNIILNEKKIQKLNTQFQKVNNIEQQTQNASECIQNQTEQLTKNKKSDFHNFIKTQSHQSYHTPQIDQLGERMLKLRKKAESLDKKLKRTSYGVGKRRDDEVHQYISEARKELEQSQKYLAEADS